MRGTIPRHTPTLSFNFKSTLPAIRCSHSSVSCTGTHPSGQNGGIKLNRHAVSANANPRHSDCPRSTRAYTNYKKSTRPCLFPSHHPFSTTTTKPNKMSGPGASNTALLASNLFSVDGLVAVVTGGATGIGLMITQGKCHPKSLTAPC